jgi:DMSO reductase anchor subunit
MLVVLIIALMAQTSMLEVAETEYALAAQQETLKGMLEGDYATFYMARWVVGVGLALVCALALALPLKKKSMATAAAITVVLFLFVLIGEIMGRAVLFGTNVPLGHVLPDIGGFYTTLGL